MEPWQAMICQTHLENILKILSVDDDDTEVMNHIINYVESRKLINIFDGDISLEEISRLEKILKETKLDTPQSRYMFEVKK